MPPAWRPGARWPAARSCRRFPRGAATCPSVTRRTTTAMVRGSSQCMAPTASTIGPCLTRFEGKAREVVSASRVVGNPKGSGVMQFAETLHTNDKGVAAHESRKTQRRMNCRVYSIADYQQLKGRASAAGRLATWGMRVFAAWTTAVLLLQLLAPPRLFASQTCSADADCGKYGACINGQCCKPADFDNRCGGKCGVKCPDASICKVNSDCDSGACSDHRCCGPQCNGNCANSCRDGLGCATGGDCRSFGCVNGKCCAPADANNQCGGTCSAKCPDAAICRTNADCQNGACSGGRCCGPSCNGNCT